MVQQAVASFYWIIFLNIILRLGNKMNYKYRNFIFVINFKLE